VGSGSPSGSQRIAGEKSKPRGPEDGQRFSAGKHAANWRIIVVHTGLALQRLFKV
jgi:hypothetical protein